MILENDRSLRTSQNTWEQSRTRVTQIKSEMLDWEWDWARASRYMWYLGVELELWFPVPRADFLRLANLGKRLSYDLAFGSREAEGDRIRLTFTRINWKKTSRSCSALRPKNSGEQNLRLKDGVKDLYANSVPCTQLMYLLKWYVIQVSVVVFMYIVYYSLIVYGLIVLYRNCIFVFLYYSCIVQYS